MEKSEKKPAYKHCLNCIYRRKVAFDTTGMYQCTIKHTDCNDFGRVKALLCKFFEDNDVQKSVAN